MLRLMQKVDQQDQLRKTASSYCKVFLYTPKRTCISSWSCMTSSVNQDTCLYLSQLARVSRDLCFSYAVKIHWDVWVYPNTRKWEWNPNISIFTHLKQKTSLLCIIGCDMYNNKHSILFCNHKSPFLLGLNIWTKMFTRQSSYWIICCRCRV